MKKIPLYNHQKKIRDYFVIDNEDFNKIKNYKWRLYYDKNKNLKYVLTTDKNKKTLFLHRYIMNCPNNMIIDHKNHNGLDNQKNNLRICNYINNNRNKKKCKNSTSKYKGVYWNKYHKKWEVSIKNKNEKKFLGYFNNEKEAAKKYNNYAILHYNEYAYLNEV